MLAKEVIQLLEQEQGDSNPLVFAQTVTTGSLGYGVPKQLTCPVCDSNRVDINGVNHKERKCTACGFNWKRR